MENRVTRDHVFFAFSKDLPPVLSIQPGDEVVLETHDCFEGQLKSEKDLVDALDWDHVNPATGPVYLTGAQPGDLLKLEIRKIKVADTSIMVTVPGEGALGERITQMETAVLKKENGTIVFKDKIRVSTAPMIGVIGLAPAEGQVGNGTPDTHGGNMDCTLIKEGSTVYFRVNVDGALFGAGDFHAAMGDGEIVVCGAETAGEVTLKASLVKDQPALPTPFVVTPDLVATIFSAPGIDEATAGAIDQMATFLTDVVKLPLNDAGMLMSLVGQAKFCQVVDPAKTIRFEFPRAVLEQYGFEMF